MVMNPISLLHLGKLYGTATVIETLVLMVILMSLFLLFGAMAAGIPEVTLGKALLSAVLMISVQWIIVVVFSFIPLIGGFLGFIISIIAMTYVLKVTFGVAWATAFLTFLFAILAEVATGMIVDLYLGIGLTNFAQRFVFVS
ncbi:MAG: hypothetical protein GXO65_07350 [Euryarchaeota archaeon]|nr:hypothetical protein [Euryarchaeota archaeon]